MVAKADSREAIMCRISFLHARPIEGMAVGPPSGGMPR